MNALKLVTVLIFVTISHAKSQDYAFKVLVNKGKNELKATDGWQPIKVGASIKAKDEIKISENAYLGLAHINGKTLELKKPGNYKVEDLSASMGGGVSVINKYTDFILTANSTKTNKLSATGAVSRGGDIHLLLPSNAQSPHIYNDVVIINWDVDKIPGPYVVKFRSMFDDALLQLETKENNVSINLNDSHFANEDNIIVTVESKNDKSKVSAGYTLKRASKADKIRIKSALDEMQASSLEETALNKLVLASFYEQNGLMIDAITSHLEAIKLAPDVPLFKENYTDFLLRNDLKKSIPKVER